MNEWQPIESAPEELNRCFLWCSDIAMDWTTGKAGPRGLVLGRTMWGKPYGDGMNGDWTFSHWMPLPPPPAKA
jgi:hypothetical protein